LDADAEIMEILKAELQIESDTTEEFNLEKIMELESQLERMKAEMATAAIESEKQKLQIYKLSHDIEVQKNLATYTDVKHQFALELMRAGNGNSRVSMIV